MTTHKTHSLHPDVVTCLFACCAMLCTSCDTTHDVSVTLVVTPTNYLCAFDSFYLQFLANSNQCTSHDVCWTASDLDGTVLSMYPCPYLLARDSHNEEYGHFVESATIYLRGQTSLRRLICISHPGATPENYRLLTNNILAYDLVMRTSKLATVHYNYKSDTLMIQH